MNLVVIGVNHKTAPVALRERLAFADDITEAQTQLQNITAGSLIISTCNRTEIYALAPLTKAPATNADTMSPAPIAGHIAEHKPIRATEFTDQLIEWLASFKQLSVGEIKPYLYDYIDSQALTHWVRVAAGLDSMILGEPQIFGQIKRTVSQAKEAGFVTNHLNWVVQQIFAASKRVRNETDVGTQAITLGFAATKLVTQIFDEPKNTTLLVVAAGEMNRLVSLNITELGIKRVIICNRTPERAEILAEELRHPGLEVDVYPLTELGSLLPQADIVSSCSGSMNSLIDKSMTKAALKRRRYQPMLMVDLAVPRDIEPSVGKLDDVFLYSIDDLQHVIAGNIEKRRQAAVEAELLVSHLVVEIEQRYQVRKVGQDIYDYRRLAASKADKVLSEAIHQLHNSDQTPEQIMVELTRRLTQTLAHAPSSLMRRAARDGDADTLEMVLSGLKDAYRSK